MLDIRFSSCQPKDKVSFGKCLANARASSKQDVNPGYNKNVSFCQVRQSCFKMTNYRQICYKRELELPSAMCQCSKRLRLANYVKRYKSCATSWGVSIKNETFDYNIIMLKNMNNSTRYSLYRLQ